MLTDTLSHTRLLEEAPDAVIVADREGTIRLWNRAAERMFGYSPTEAVGRSLDLIVPERFREQHWAGYKRAMEAGHTKYGRDILLTRTARKNDSTLYIDLALAVLTDAGGQAVGAMGMARDVTARREQERAMQDRLAALEREVQALREGFTRGG